MIVFAHTKFGLVRIQGSGVKRGAESAPPRSERVFQIPVQIRLNLQWSCKFQSLREQSLRMLQTGAEEILLGYETIF